MRNIININNGNNVISDTLKRKNRHLFLLAYDKKKKLIYCSTNDNLIYVYNDKLENTDYISMGAKVTALDLLNDDKRSIIYFGTASGYIGFISYEAHKGTNRFLKIN